jgi:Gtr1/RagA G protein conserved region
MDQYFQSQKENIFRNVEVLIYVFDVESREIDKVIISYCNNRNNNNNNNFFKKILGYALLSILP